MILIRKSHHDSVVEFGGGSCPLFRPNVDVRLCYGADGVCTVDFTADFEDLPLPMAPDEFDAAFSQHCLNYLSWRKLRGFVSEVKRILKPGGKVVFVMADMDKKIEKFVGVGFAKLSASLFGGQTHGRDGFKCYLTQPIVKSLFEDVGFVGVSVRLYGETDMCIEAFKPERV